MANVKLTKVGKVYADSAQGSVRAVEAVGIDQVAVGVFDDHRRLPGKDVAHREPHATMQLSRGCANSDGEKR